ncbi:MAG: AmmeMemoRadiSam system protein A [Alphaproteobacteria bacterium]
MSSTDALEAVLARFGPALLDLAGDSITHGLTSGRPLAVSTADYAAELRRKVASFVTLHLDGKLRGCTGSVTACRPLVEDVAINAYHSAFDDPRFDPVAQDEAPRLEVEISLLTEAEPMAFSSQDDLIGQIVPGRDGLILEQDGKRGLFLPQVWDNVGDSQDFLDHLKVKAGLKKRFWSPDIRISRFFALKAARD